MNSDEVRRLKQSEQENARLKKFLAERDLKIEVMKGSRQKSGGRVRPSPAGRFRGESRAVATSVHAAISCPIIIALRAALS